MFVLVTGARAPVAIEWANLLTRLGHSVILTDSLDKPLGAYCQHIEQYIKTHSPRFNFTHYQSEILVIIDQIGGCVVGKQVVDAGGHFKCTFITMVAHGCLPLRV